jgi:4-diphosphocytidyl-2-C-methyl-D-erythritol kinase
MQLQAPAKINLSFEIKTRRADGFHDIETLMAPISLHDNLTIERISNGQAIEFSCDDPTLPKGEDNLVVKSARLFQKAAKVSDGVRIRLEKKIPHGAGLGGGSSDAASTLIGLNKLFKGDLSKNDLMELGAQIGSDVPFFVAESVAYCRGRGELVEPATLPQSLSLLLLKPEFGVPTPWAYGRWKDSLELSGIQYAEQRFRGIRFINDLERPVFEKFVILGYLKSWLCQQAEVGAALMSGSGSTVFAVLGDAADAEGLTRRVQEHIDARIWSYVCVAQG